MSNFRKQHLNPKNLAMMAVLLAAEIILSRFLSLSLPFVKIGFAFIPIAVAARMLGTAEAVTVAMLGDFLGAILFPIGPYFPGFTLTAGLRGLSNALFFHKTANLPRIAASVAVNEVIGSILLNTLWISMLYGSPFLTLLPTRLLQSAVMVAVQIPLLWVLFTKSGKLLENRRMA